MLVRRKGNGDEHEQLTVVSYRSESRLLEVVPCDVLHVRGKVSLTLGHERRRTRKRRRERTSTIAV
jgi:hypothetical protein